MYIYIYSNGWRRRVQFGTWVLLQLIYIIQTLKLRCGHCRLYIIYYIWCVCVVFLLWIFLAHDIFFSSLTETFFSHVRRVGYSFQPKNKISYHIYTYKSIHRFRVGLSRCYNSLVMVLFFSGVCEIITWREK